MKGDPASRLETQRVAHVPHQRITPTIAVSDSSLKFTHVLYNLSPAGSLLLFLFIHFFYVLYGKELINYHDIFIKVNEYI